MSFKLQIPVCKELGDSEFDSQLIVELVKVNCWFVDSTLVIAKRGCKEGLVFAGTVQRIMCDWKRFYQGRDFTKKPICEITKIDVDRFLQSVAGAEGLNK